jgi:hypothetical protein
VEEALNDVATRRQTRSHTVDSCFSDEDSPLAKRHKKAVRFLHLRVAVISCTKCCDRTLYFTNTLQ